MFIKGVIFDLDGTLADTLSDIAGAMNRTLARAGFPTHPADEYKFMIGRGLENLVTTALPAESRLPETISACHSRFVQDYSVHCVVDTRLYSGIRELLLDLTNKDFKLSVFSNKAHDLTCRIVETLIPEVQFAEVMGARSGQPKKPDPAVALDICRQMQLPPENVVYLGDSDVDMMTAKRAGMQAVGVTWGFRPAKELTDNGADVLIDHPSQFWDHIW
jgi:phosphoglycolate phosphatase